MIEGGGGFGFKHCLGWQRSVLQFIVFDGFVQDEEGEEDEQGESSHVLKVATAAWPDVHQE